MATIFPLEKMENFNTLPNEIINYILELLPYESLLNVRLTCGRFYLLCPKLYTKWISNTLNLAQKINYNRLNVRVYFRELVNLRSIPVHTLKISTGELDQYKLSLSNIKCLSIYMGRDRDSRLNISAKLPEKLEILTLHGFYCKFNTKFNTKKIPSKINLLILKNCNNVDLSLISDNIKNVETYNCRNIKFSKHISTKKFNTPEVVPFFFNSPKGCISKYIMLNYSDVKINVELKSLFP